MKQPKEIHIWVKRPAKIAQRDAKPAPKPAAKPCGCGGKHRV